MENEDNVNVCGTNNEKVPFEIDVSLRDRIKKYAEKHNYIISEFVTKKIKWSETHGGRCFCSPFERMKCPCDNVSEDMKAYNGRCLCRLFWKPKTYIKLMEQRKKQKPPDKKQSSRKKTKEQLITEKAEKEIIKKVWNNLK